MRSLLTLTANDLVQGVRDKSVLLFGLVVPLLLMFVFNLVFGSTDETEFSPITVAVEAPADDQVAGTVVEAFGQLEQIGLDVTVAESDDDAALRMVFPEKFTESVTSGNPATVQVFESDDAGLEGMVVMSVLEQVLDQFTHGTVAAYAGASAGVPVDQLEALARDVATSSTTYELVEGETADEQLAQGAALVAGQTGLFLLFTVGFGVTKLLIEREDGTLARLRSLPIPGSTVVAAKALMSFLLGVLSTSVLLTVGGWFFDADFGFLPAVAALVVGAAAAATSLMFLIVRLAATSEQAGVGTSICAVVFGIGGGAFFPVVTTSPVISTLLDLNPVAALLRGLGATSAGGGFSDIAAPLGIMAGFALVMFTVARLVPDRGALS
ncbi:ABC transporter permease [Nocardioides daphniae]|uniref:ABC transporter permease n=1 Tax=Nocardioides daphniae TaxID=402297 RepID=A0A4V1CWQ3_9ACTN|nr:ABC transporter permease [Nocardioides daphniae]QCC78067.1 ABC transporter permease [Nocardioides daphniae]GGD22466.1 hypothetical protein GCM10007231_21960 [Nocardioides daphniae]